MKRMLIVFLLLPSILFATDEYWFNVPYENSRSILYPPLEECGGSSAEVEYGNPSVESSEPEVYHWDNIYLEPVAPEVIINPYQ